MKLMAPAVAIFVALLVSAGRAQSVQEAFERAIDSFAETENVVELKKDLEAIISVDSSHASALFNLGIIAQADEDWSQAINYFERVIALKSNPGLSARATRERDISARMIKLSKSGKEVLAYDTCVTRAKALVSSQLYKAALLESQHCLDINSQGWEAMAIQAIAVSEVDNNVSAAVRILERAIKSAPKSEHEALRKALSELKVR